MDNNYGQQYIQNTNSIPAQPTGSADDSGSSKMPLIISIALSAVVLVESILLLVTITNYFSIMNESELENESYDDSEDASINDDYAFDKNDNIIAFNGSCRSNNGSRYEFTKDGKFQYFDTSSNPVNSGTYTMTDEVVINLSDSDKTLYFGDEYVVDGNTVYDCADESTQSE